MADELKELNVLNKSERCRHLFSKGILMNAGLPPGEEFIGDGNFWCANTQTVFGPDNEICDDAECCDGSRSCYEAP